LSYGASGNQIYLNIFVKSKDGYANITAFNLSGSGNIVRDNVGWESSGVMQNGITGLSDGGGNLFINPSLANPTNDNFVPTNATANQYGHLAP
jgi:hypothetical protein